MNPLLDEAMKEAYASAKDGGLIFHTIEINHPAFTDPIRVVSDNAPIEARIEMGASRNPGEVVTFQAMAFEMTLPEVMESGIPELQIKIDNVSLEIVKNIRLAVSTPEKLELIYRPYLPHDLLVGPHYSPPLKLTITHIEADVLNVTARASIADFINKKFPSEDYDEYTFPWLVA